MTRRQRPGGLSRRAFLTGIGAAAALSAIGIYQLKDYLAAVTPTPSGVARFVSTSMPTATSAASPTGTPSPVTPPRVAPTASVTLGQSPLPSPTGTGTLAVSPTPTATSTPSPTPTYTPTPTPTPTPYPPGPPSKLGIFTTRAEGQINTLIREGKPALLKTLNLDPNLARFTKEHSPITIVIARLSLDQLDLTADPIPLAHQLASQLLEHALEPVRFQYFDAWEGYNEPVADTPDKMKRLADLEAERTRLLGEQGIRSVVGNFGAGHPPMELWEYFTPALEAVRQYKGYLGLHEYSAPIMQYGFGKLQERGGDEGDEGWLTIRYRKAYRHYLRPLGYGDIPILITECGVDGTVRPRPGPDEAKGWRDFEEFWIENGLRTDAPGVYMDQLIWYDSELQKDDYVKGAAIFAAGASPGWESYELLGRALELLTQYLKVHPPKQVPR